MLGIERAVIGGRVGEDTCEVDAALGVKVLVGVALL